ncbi:hypothetical protein [Rosistilla oblonga]|uniref:hypothetical protein n=1 Tax=Rosistilla oblonga TaxID=2527990 RepID=UPI003A969E17
MKWPLHINPDDWSPEAIQKRADHWVSMAQLNPKGFSQPSTKKKNGTHPQTRLEALVKEAYGE